jgi:hypothetical protein
MSEETLTTGEIVQGHLTEIAKAAAQQLEGMPFIIVALHGDGYVQYTTSLDPLQAGAVMVDLGGSILQPSAKPEWLDFQNKLRILNSIDRHELIEAGLMASERDLIRWQIFRENPHLWLMKADDDRAEKLWSIIEKRSAGK